MRHEPHERTAAARNPQRGAVLVEFTIGAVVFLTAVFGVLEFSRLLWTHNALSDAVRRGARFAVNQANPAEGVEEAQPVTEEEVKNMVIYGNREGTGNPVVSGLDLADVDVDYSPSSVTGIFGYPDGSVTVSITNYEFTFIVPLIATSVTMPDYKTTLTAESAGLVPPDITPTPTPGPGPSTTPTPTGSPTPDPSTTPTPAPSATPTPAPSATPTPDPDVTPTPAPSTTPTPVPSPTPKPCAKGQKVSTGCVCLPPMKVNGVGKCN